MSTATLTVPDNVWELLLAAGDAPVELAAAARTMISEVGRGTTVLPNRPTAGATTRHRIAIHIARRGYTDRFSAYMNDALIGTAPFDSGGTEVDPGDRIDLNLCIQW